VEASVSNNEINYSHSLSGPPPFNLSDESDNDIKASSTGNQLLIVDVSFPGFGFGFSGFVML
jgi:hypothetical protein